MSPREAGTVSPVGDRRRKKMTQDELKQAVARAARDYVADRLPLGAILGVGTGSTANFFIDEIAAIKHRLGGAVASSEATAKRLAGHGIRVLDLNDVDTVGIYVDGADEIDGSMAMVKGKLQAYLLHPVWQHKRN